VAQLFSLGCMAVIYGKAPRISFSFTNPERQASVSRRLEFAESRRVHKVVGILWRHDFSDSPSQQRVGADIVLSRHIFMSVHEMQSNKSPEPTAVGAVSSAIAVHVASRRWLSFLR
jgi:hypothetical protein